MAVLETYHAFRPFSLAKSHVKTSGSDYIAGTNWSYGTFANNQNIQPFDKEFKFSDSKIEFYFHNVQFKNPEMGSGIYIYGSIAILFKNTQQSGGSSSDDDFVVEETTPTAQYTLYQKNIDGNAIIDSPSILGFRISIPIDPTLRGHLNSYEISEVRVSGKKSYLFSPTTTPYFYLGTIPGKIPDQYGDESDIDFPAVFSTKSVCEIRVKNPYSSEYPEDNIALELDPTSYDTDGSNKIINERKKLKFKIYNSNPYRDVFTICPYKYSVSYLTRYNGNSSSMMYSLDSTIIPEQIIEDSLSPILFDNSVLLHYFDKRNKARVYASDLLVYTYYADNTIMSSLKESGISYLPVNYDDFLYGNDKFTSNFVANLLVKKRHIIDMQTAVNHLRIGFRLDEYEFSEVKYIANWVLNITELRDALYEICLKQRNIYPGLPSLANSWVKTNAAIGDKKGLNYPRYSVMKELHDNIRAVSNTVV